MSVYLYKPPVWRNPVQFGDYVLAYIHTSTTVYRVDGTWYNAQSPDVSSNDVDVDEDSGLTLLFSKPTVVPGSLYDGLAALEPADSSWTEGSLTEL